MEERLTAIYTVVRMFDEDMIVFLEKLQLPFDEHIFGYIQKPLYSLINSYKDSSCIVVSCSPPSRSTLTFCKVEHPECLGGYIEFGFGKVISSTKLDGSQVLNREQW